MRDCPKPGKPGAAAAAVRRPGASPSDRIPPAAVFSRTPPARRRNLSRCAAADLLQTIQEFSMSTTIAVIRGDGIGPEIMDATLRVLDALRLGITYDF